MPVIQQHKDEWRFGLLGKDISYSLSPWLHNRHTVTRELGIEVPDYHIFDIASASAVIDFLDQFVQQPKAVGLNVTAPYKTLVAQYFEAPTSAVNTVYRTRAQQFQACSTDPIGFIQALQQLQGFHPNQITHMVFLGNGGSVLSLLEWLSHHPTHFPKLTKVSLHRRHAHKDHLLKNLESEKLPFYLQEFSPSALQQSLQEAPAHTLLVQATSAPHQGNSLQRFTSALDGFSGFFYDLCYSPPSILYQQHARSYPQRALSGGGMLIEQARASQQLWWHTSLSHASMRAVLRTYTHTGEI
ncbi:MAG: hypothetical protein OXT67_00860 [Zetaproteobacteria bacterium]|nr:hypothetical protein [Zetaproteobacteria bacterium]